MTFRNAALNFSMSSYADVRGPSGPDTTDIDVLLRHRLDDFLAGPLHVDHELVAFGGHEREVTFFEELEHIVAYVADDFPALRHERLHFEAGVRSDHTGHRQGPGSVAHHLLEQIGPSDCGACPQSRHPVELRESPQNEKVLISGDKIGARDCVLRQVDVGFIEDKDAALGLICEDVFDVFARGQRSCRVVRIADVDQAGVRVRRDHRFHVVRVFLG